MDTKDFFSTRDIARACGVSTQAIRNWVIEKKVKDVQKAGGRRVFIQADMDRFVAFAKSRKERKM